MITEFLFLAAVGTVLCLMFAGIVLEIIDWYLEHTDVRRKEKK